MKREDRSTKSNKVKNIFRTESCGKAAIFSHSPENALLIYSHRPLAVLVVT